MLNANSYLLLYTSAETSHAFVVYIFMGHYHNNDEYCNAGCDPRNRVADPKHQGSLVEGIHRRHPNDPECANANEIGDHLHYGVAISLERARIDVHYTVDHRDTHYDCETKLCKFYCLGCTRDKEPKELSAESDYRNGVYGHKSRYRKVCSLKHLTDALSVARADILTDKGYDRRHKGIIYCWIFNPKYPFR